MGGSIIRTSVRAHLLVVYTGNNCKLMFGNKRKFGKKSSIDIEGRSYQKMMILVTNVLCVFCAVFHLVYLFINKQFFSVWVDFSSVNWFFHFIKKMFTWQLLLAKMVPINLIMTTRLVKYLQAKRMTNIIGKRKQENKNSTGVSGVPPGDIYNPDSNEDLGLVDYMFIDKTGTLTSPDLTVSRVHVGTYTFEQRVIFTPEEDNPDDGDLRDDKLVELLKDEGSEGEKCKDLLRCMVICNNVEFMKDDQLNNKATSPDELAFIDFAKIYGMTMANSDNKFKMREIDEMLGQDKSEDEMDNEDQVDEGFQKWEILFQFDFDPETRRMGMLVLKKEWLMPEPDRTEEDNYKYIPHFRIYVKGSLESMGSIVDLGKSPDFEDILIKVEDDLARGKRSMFFGMRDFTYQEVFHILTENMPNMREKYKKKKGKKTKSRQGRKFENLKESGAEGGNGPDESEETRMKMLQDIEQILVPSYPKDQMHVLRDEFESDLQFLGATMCEERLEDKIHHTFKFIRMADIKTWVLTGDNLENTLFICNKIGLIGRGSQVRTVYKLDDIDMITEGEYVKLNSRIGSLKTGRKFALAVSGEYFAKILGYENTNKLLYKQFVAILLRCETAVFGNMAPVQKAAVVNIVKVNDPKKITLAIGDGINDIEMLIEAHVGVAIFRDTQYNTAKFSDYYIKKFHQIKLLLFYFGRECYRRNCKLFLYMFFKNMLYSMTTFWAGSLNFFTGLGMKSTLVTNSFALILTAFPMIVYGVFDKIYTKDQMLYSPKFYETGKRRLYLNRKNFMFEMFLGLLFSAYITFNALLMFDWGNYGGGNFYGWYIMGNMVSMSIIISVNLRILVLANAISIWNLLVTFFSIGCFFGIWYFENTQPNNSLYNTFFLVIQSRQFMLYMVYVFSISIIEYLIIKIEFYHIDKKFVPDFDVKFDAVTDTGAGDVNMEFSGVSNRDIDIGHDNQGGYDDGEFYSDDNSQYQDYSESPSN